MIRTVQAFQLQLELSVYGLGEQSFANVMASSTVAPFLTTAA